MIPVEHVVTSEYSSFCMPDTTPMSLKNAIIVLKVKCSSGITLVMKNSAKTSCKQILISITGSAFTCAK